MNSGIEVQGKNLSKIVMKNQPPLPNPGNLFGQNDRAGCATTFAPPGITTLQPQ